MLSVSTCKEKNVKGYLNKPLYKQKFYLDVKNRAVASKLEAKIKELGGDIELFLVKDIKGLITDRDDFGVTNNKTFTPKTPQPGSNQSFFNSPIGNENDKTRPKTRADAMLAKARVQSSVSTKDPLEEAKIWGISILSIEKAFVWLDKVELSVKLSLEKKKLKAVDLKAPYLKFEAFDRKTRPVFQEIPNWPTFNLNGAEGEPAFICRSLREHTMTRKTRAHNAKTINLLQPGYCEACRVEYAYLEEHLKSDEHQNFINDSDNFKELDDLINDGCNIGSFLKVNGASLGKYPDRNNKCASPIKTVIFPKKMPRTRTSTVCDKQKPLLSPTGSDSGHNLRTRRKNSVFNSISSGCEEEVVLKPVRELRSSTRLSAMAPKGNSMEDSDTWSSGRPKRSCIKQKRVSADERLVFDNKTYYRVEVLSNKLRSSAVPLRGPETPKVQANSEEGQEDKGLIVKFRKMRYSELARLNDEAENFLFPRRDESSSEEDVDDDAPHSTQSPRKDESSVLLSSEPDTKISGIKNEEDHSMDSNCSEYSVGRKKKRRTQAEAFIADNQKYYKFEMPGSRLRYQGSYLSPLGAKNNGDCLVNDGDSKSEQKDEFKETKVNLSDVQFSFESVPKSEPWYQTFQRQDNGEEYYYCNFSDSGYWKPFILPYEIGPLPPVDPRICIMAYRQSQKVTEEINTLKENHTPSESASQGGGSPAASPVKSEPAQIANISKETLVQSDREVKVEHPTETKSNNFRKPGRRRKGILLPSRNPRKSPRQHASTLAILSSLIHQRKRREGKISRSPDNSSSITTLSSIPEERKVTKSLNEIELEQDYESIAKSIDEVLSVSLEEIPVNINLLREDENNEEVKLKYEMGAIDLLEDYSNHIEKQNQQKLVEIDNWPAKVSPGRRCGRKKKKNRTGWPNKNRRVYLKKEDKEDNDLSEQESMIDSPGVNQDSEDADDDETNGLNNHKTAVNSNCKYDEQCMINSNSGTSVNNNEQQNGDKQGTNTTMTMTNGPLSEPKRLDAKCREQRKSSSDCYAELVVASVGEKMTDGGGVNVDLDKWESAEKVLNARLSNSDSISVDKQLQPIVRVEKLEGGTTTTLKRERQSSLSPRRTNKRPRRMPASPKSPRILRKPRGRWYRERF